MVQKIARCTTYMRNLVVTVDFQEHDDAPMKRVERPRK